MMKKTLGEEYRNTIVCVDSYENGVLCGSLHNPYLSGAAPFFSLSQFLLQMEDMMDAMAFPQSFGQMRTFSPRKISRLSASSYAESSGAPEGRQYKGELATFFIRMLFRQNESWQGTVVWREKKKEESFRSALELVRLMDSALELVKCEDSTFLPVSNE